MAKSLIKRFKFAFDWALPVPKKNERFLRETVFVWRRVWCGCLVSSVLLGWVPLVKDPTDWRAYLNYYGSALIGLVAIVGLSWLKPLPGPSYKHGLLPMAFFGFAATISTWIAAMLNPQQIIGAIPKYGHILAPVAERLTGAQTGFMAPFIVFGLSAMNALVGYGVFLIQRAHCQEPLVAPETDC